jgi:uncharacterized protein (TIGR00251 family)
MQIRDYIRSGTLSVHAKPNSPKTEIIGWDESTQSLKIAIAAVPDKDRANIELLKFLKKETGLKPALVSGAKSRGKKIRFS